MKKIVLTSLLLFSLPLLVFGQINIPGMGQNVKPAPNVGPLEVLDKVVNIIYTFILVVGVIGILYGAFIFVTAGGDALAIGKGRTILMWSIAAIIIAVAAKGIVGFVESQLGGGSLFGP
jgi:hypothetical protein